MVAFLRRIVRLSLLLIVCHLAGASGNAETPRATFALEGKWMKCRVSRDGKPVAGVTLDILDVHGRPFANGEADDEGLGEFPLPPGDELTLLIRVDGKTADAVRLTREGAGVFPGEVMLTFGLAPCCRVASRRDSSDPPASSAADGDEQVVSLALGIGVLLAGAIAIVLWNNASPIQDSVPPRKRTG